MSLKQHKARKEDIILDMDMLEKRIHKLLKLGEHQTIARTGIGRRLEIIHQFLDKLVAHNLVVVLRWSAEREFKTIRTLRP